MTFKPGIHVFDKLGRPTGIIGRYEVVDSPSYVINDVGSFRFYLARRQWEQMYLKLDRMVMLGSSLGMPPWAGQIDEIEYGGGVIQVSCSGLLDQFKTAIIEMDEELADNTPAWAVYARIVQIANKQKGANGEVQWRVSYQGSKPYFGDLSLSTDAYSAISDTALRSDTEFYAAAHIDRTTARLVPTLHVSDYFMAGVGKELKDGLNVVTEPRWSTESRPVTHTIRLTGAETNISQYVPQWMRWAVHEFEPVVELNVPPGELRKRADLEATVDWSLSKKEQRRLANLTMTQYWDMYRSFLRAVHDMDGRPWHPGWEWTGPSDTHQMLHTGLGWRNQLTLVERKGLPATMVMQSRSERMVALVWFSRTNGQQYFERTWYQDARSAAELLLMEVNGTKMRYTVEGGVIVARDKVLLDHRKAFVTPYTVAYLNPETMTWTNLRRCIGSEGNLLEGDFFTDVKPNTPTISGSPYLRFTKVYVPHSIELQSAFIGKMYTLEKERISEWDPRRDGVGRSLSVPTVYHQQPVTRPRWHVVPWAPGRGGTARLVHGVNQTAQVFPITTTFDLPPAPFDAEINQGSMMEVIRVVKIIGGGEIQVLRARAGTTAKIHEVGASIQAIGVTEFEGLKYPYTWPEGSAWLQKLIAKQSQAPIRLSIQVVNKDDLWRDIVLGRGHVLSLRSEGPGATGTAFRVRVIGFSPDNKNGTMELLLEKLA